MRLRVSYAVNVDDDFRRAIRHYYGKVGLATHAEIAHWFREYGGTMDDDLRHEHGRCCWGDESDPEDAA